MRRLRLWILVLASFTLAVLVVDAQSQSAPQEKTPPNAPSAAVEPLIRFSVEFGAEGRFISDGDRWTKFVQHRDIPDNFTINNLNFVIGGQDSRWSLLGTALDAGQLDQRYRLVLEKFGASRTSFRFVSFPYFYS